MARKLSLLILVLALLAGAAPLFAEEPSDELLDSWYGKNVSAVEYDIPRYMNAKAIRKASKIKKNAPLDRWRVRKTLRNFNLIDEVANVAIRVTPLDDDTVKVLVKVYPLYILRDIRVVGNLTFNVNEILEDILRIEPGDDFRKEMEEEYKQRLQEAYSRAGHFKAKIKIDVHMTKRRDDNKADLRIKITERQLYKVADFDFSEAHLGIYTQEEILKIAKWRVGMGFTEEDIQKGLKRLKKWLQKAGHLEARLPDLDFSDLGVFEINDEKSEVKIPFPLRVGPRVDIIYRENCFSCAEQKWKLDDVLGIENQRRFNKWIARDFARKVRIFLARQGYYTATVKAKFRRYKEPDGLWVKEILLIADRGPKISIRSIDFKENPNFTDSELRALLKNKTIYVEEDFEQDLKNVINHYNSQGFLQAKVVQKVVDLDEEKRSLDIMVVLDEGPRTYVRSIKFRQNKMCKLSEFREELQEDDTRLVVGEPFNPFVMDKVKALFLTRYLRQGYAKARIKTTATLSEDSEHVDLVFTFTEGRRYFFGDLYFRGNKLTKQHVIERELVVVEGRPYNFEKIFRSEQALIQLGHFNNVDIHPVSQDFDEERVDMIVYVDERKSGYITGGLGYNTYTGFRGVYELGHRNLAGHGRQLGYRFEAFVTDMSFVFDQRIMAVTFTWPWVGRVPLDATFTIKDSQLAEIAYDVRTLGVTVGTSITWTKMLNFLDATHPSQNVREFAGAESTHKLIDPFTTKLDYEFARDYIYDIDSAVSDQSQGAVTITTVSPMVIYDLRDNVFNPTRWNYDSIRFDYGAPWLMSQIHYLKVTGQTSWYFPIFEIMPFLSGWVIAENFVVGHAQVLRETDTIPISRRFFLGGSTTLRGFGQNEISPTGDDGRTPVGGYFLAYHNSEIRLPLGETGLGLLLFFDTGNVTDGTNKFYIDRMRATSGFGLRYLTPIGPISGDCGFKLNKEPDESIFEAYLTIGNAF